MAKKKFGIPSFVNFDQIDSGSSGDYTGGGTAQSTTDDDQPYDFEVWSVIFDYIDADNDGESGTWADYVKWMTDHGWQDLIDPTEEP